MNNPFFDLPYLNKKEISKLLDARPLEDKKIISDIEIFFNKRRGYSIKIPKKGTPIVLLLSGGLDTSIMWDILMRKYELHVYPLYLRRGQIRMPLEEKAVDFFARFYKKKYPKLYHEPKKATTFIPPLEIRWEITRYGHSPVLRTPKTLLGIPTYSSLLADYAVQYAYYLQMNSKIKIRDIFCGFMPIDGTFFKYETLTALRSNMYNICNLTNDYSWQFTSLALEKEFRFFFNKNALIKWAKNYNLPIEKSNSCIKFSYFHCGTCGYCNFRKKSFLDSNIPDKTIYLNQLKPKLFFQIISRILLILITIQFLVRVWLTLVKNFIYYLPSKY